MNEYIWTYWTKPQLGNVSYFDIACLGLSTALASKHGTARLIYTDDAGAKQIDRYKIKAPHRITLNELDDEDPRKWALPKINTFSKIDYPCIHIDYDVFLWNKQKESYADFCMQSLEYGELFVNIYKSTFDDFLNDAGYCPSEISSYSSNGIFAGYNMGYIKINNHGFLKEYCDSSIRIFNKMKTFHRHNNVFPEQYLFYCMSKTNGMSVDFLFDNNTDWNEQCTASGYTHLMEEKKKNRNGLFKRIMAKLESENPECHAAISGEIDWSVYDVGKSFVNSVSSIAKSGMKKVDDETFERRTSICKQCEHHDPAGYGGTGRCSICKCSTVAKPRLEASKCPIGKW